MTRVPGRPSDDRWPAAIEARLNRLESIVAGLPRVATTPPSTPTYDSSVLTNGDAESGTSAWGLGYWAGGGPGPGSLTTTNVDPLEGSRSFLLRETNDSTTMFWYTGGYVPVTPGDVWKASCIAKPSGLSAAELASLGGANFVLRIHTGLNLSGAGDPYQIFDANTTWLDVATIPASLTEPTVLSGTGTIPANRFYMGLSVRLENFTVPTHDFEVKYDALSLRRRL